MDDVLEWSVESFAEAEFDMMGMIKLSSLNKVVIEYALNAMVEYNFLGCGYWYLMCMYFPFKLFKSRFGHKSEAVMNTQGLSRSLVVASCAMDTRDVAYSDFSGKKQRQTVLKDFPLRRNDFNAWYRGDSKQLTIVITVEPYSEDYKWREAKSSYGAGILIGMSKLATTTFMWHLTEEICQKLWMNTCLKYGAN